MIKLVILDMDGTMFDTEPLWDKAFMEANKILGYNVNEELHQRIIGSNGKTTEMILKNSLGEDYPFQKFNKLYFDTLINLVNKEGIKIKPGLIELLNYTSQVELFNYNGIDGLHGIIFIGKNKKSIFIPMAGSMSSSVKVSMNARYWTSTLSKETPMDAYYLDWGRGYQTG